MSTTPDLSRLRIPRDDAPKPSSGGSRVLLIAIALVLVLAAVAWMLLRPRATEVQVAQVSAMGGGSASAAGITANGYVVARTKASVSAKVLGRLEYLGVSEGSRVRQGEVLARIESADYRAALDAAQARVGQLKAEVDQANRDLERAERLSQGKVISDTEVESARTRATSLAAQYEGAKAQVALANANLENTQVRAPFGGTVLRKDAEV